jgi:iron(III) transport system ATP-binding protein
VRPLLEVWNAVHGYDDRFLLTVGHWQLFPGQVVAVVGPSGSGKSTFLKILGAHLTPDEGEVRFRSRRVPPAEDRLLPGIPGVALVRQDFGQMPFRKVRENVLHFVHTESDSQEAAWSRRWLTSVGLDGWEDAPTHTLSGGQLQRLALAQALASKPHVLLLDEPFSHLDPATKRTLLDDLRTWQRQSKRSVVVVVHDVRDALEWADRIDVFHGGSWIASDAPQTLYLRPPRLEVARMFGRVNEIPLERANELFHAPLPGHPVGDTLVVYPEQLLPGHFRVLPPVLRQDFQGDRTWNVYDSPVGLLYGAAEGPRMGA